MSELLVELRADAFDPIAIPAALQGLRDALVEELQAIGTIPRQVATAATVRRLVVLLRGLPSAIESAADAATVEGGDAAVSASTASAVGRAVARCRFPGSDDAATARRWHASLRGLLVLLDDTPLEVAAGELRSRAETTGHPTLSPAPIAVRSVDGYRAELLRAGIEVRVPERRKLLRDRLFAAAAAAGGELVEDAALLELATLGCEIPGVVVGELEPEHLQLPRELVAIALRERLRAFLLVRAGRPMPRFLAVLDRPDDPSGRAARGASWTASALLQDLAFHRARDRAVPLAQRARELDAELWRPGLGTWGQRVERLVALVRELGEHWGWNGEVDRASEAARLLHADAATALGRELPELRGVIAGLLAREDGYPDAVWQALYDHDRPATGNSLLPRGRCGSLVAFAHWIDTLAGGALARELPGREEDAGVAGPAARGECRRAARSLLRVALQRGLPVDLHILAARALRRYAVQGFAVTAALPRLTGFLEASARALFESEGFAPEEVAAVLGAPASSLLDDVQARLRALRDMRRDPELRLRLDALVHTARRLEKLVGDAPEERVEVRSLESEEEKDLFVALQAAARRAAGLVVATRPSGWLEHMEALDAALQRFLRQILVRDDDQRLRRNRLALLQEARRLYGGQVRLAELGGNESPG